MCNIIQANTLTDELFDDAFDIVIGNPPYVRSRYLGEFKDYFAKHYKTYEGNADIYVYFYEKALNLLKDKGVLSFLTSNKWLLSKYGARLRGFLKEKTYIKNLVNLGGKKIFDAISVDASIILLRKEIKEEEYKIKIGDTKLGIEEYYVSAANLTEKSYFLEKEELIKIKKKIEQNGIPLKEWDVKIYRGVLTGCNKAFIIDDEKKEQLCKEDAKSAEILKPILRGRDIDRYHYEWKGLWLVFIPWHFPLIYENISGASKKAEKEFKLRFPAIYEHLTRYKPELVRRNQSETGIRYEWYALQRCANSYLKEFEKEKIVWAETSEKNKFTILPKYKYLDKTTFFLTTEDLDKKYLLSFLCSKIAKFYISRVANQLGKNTLSFSKFYVEQLPIPKLDLSQQKEMASMVESILSLKEEESNTDNQKKIADLDKQIDQLVYQLYDLTEEEINIIEAHIS